MNLRIFTFWCLIAGSSMSNAYSQESSMIEKITNAIQTADASKLADHFNTTIDLLIPENEGMYSNKQAEQILKVFFKNNPSDKFSLNHQGTSNDGSKYMIGTYKTTYAVSFMVYVLIKKNGENEFIYELRFEKE